MMSAPCSRRPGTSSFAVADADLYIRSGGSELIVSSHSRSTMPMMPTLIPFDEVKIIDFFALARGTPSPSAGSCLCQLRQERGWDLPT